MISADDFITQAVDGYSDTVYRIAFNITKNSHDAYDVVQEVFLRLRPAISHPSSTTTLCAASDGTYLKFSAIQV